MPPKMKVSAGKEEDHEELVEGVSSAHSWIKVQTMIRPTKLGKKRGAEDDDDDDGEESSEIMLTLTSRNPNETSAKIWWVHEDGEFKQVDFVESMIDHLEIESKIILADTMEGKLQQMKYGRCDSVEDRKGNEGPPRETKRANHFAFIERATQTKLFEAQESECQTDPPPIAVYSDTVSPAIIYDYFCQRERETNKEQENELDKDATQTIRRTSQEEVDKKLLVAAKVVERMINLNTFDDIARDFRFYEDPADEFRVPEGSLLPLWKFRFETETELEVTQLMWSPSYNDLFGLSLGSFDFYQQPRVGYVCLFSLKNPSYPEYVCEATAGVISLDIHPDHSNMVVVGLYDGNVAVYDLKNGSSQPTFSSSALTGKHRDVVWQVKWVTDNLDGYLNFFSIGGDGRVTNWTIVKTTLWHNDKLILPYSKSLTTGDNLAEYLVEGPRTIAFKPDDENIFLVGSDEGEIYLATTEFSTTFLMKYTAHTTPINSIVWNTFYPSVFLSCASEYSINIWHKDFPQPLLRYDLGSQVGDIAWSPYSSTVFSAATLDGRVMVFDLTVNKYSAICNQKILSSNQGVLNQISFNPTEPLIIAGDSKGIVHSLKLSPNLRKRNKKTEEAIKENNIKAFRQMEHSKLDDILAQVIPRD